MQYIFLYVLFQNSIASFTCGLNRYNMLKHGKVIRAKSLKCPVLPFGWNGVLDPCPVDLHPATCTRVGHEMGYLQPGSRSSWGGICTSFSWLCVSDLMTSAKETVEGSLACEIRVNTACISMRWGCCHLTIYFVAFGALTGNARYVSHQFKSQYLLLDVLLWKLSKNKVMASCPDRCA